MTRTDHSCEPLDGDQYIADDPHMARESRRAAGLAAQFNGAAADDDAGRDLILRELAWESGAGTVIRPPFRCDYGRHDWRQHGRGSWSGRNSHVAGKCRRRGKSRPHRARIVSSGYAHSLPAQHATHTFRERQHSTSRRDGLQRRNRLAHRDHERGDSSRSNLDSSAR